MDELEFIALLQAEENGAVGYFNGSIAKGQEKAMNYYHGEPFGNEEEGFSSVVSHDVASTVDGIIPDLIKVFVSGDNVVEFAPTKEGDEAFAEQATDYINHIFFKDNDGFSITHDWTKDGLLQKIGIVKAFWEDREIQVKGVYENLSNDQITSMVEEDDAEIIEATYNEETELTDITVLETKKDGRVCIEVIPPEEFLIAPATRTLESADYIAHRCERTLSELIEMGFDREMVEGLASDEETTAHDARAVQRTEDEDAVQAATNIDRSMQKVWLLEEYVRCDYDGDGYAEFRKVSRVDDTIFENMDIGEHPFVDFTPIKMPHKIFGKSIADDTIDIQLVKSTLLRQALDNLYLTNNPRTEVPEDIVTEDTFDDLLTPTPGGVIRTKGRGGLNPFGVPFTAGHSFDMLEYWDSEKEQRTGNTRYNQGLDADTLNKTATGIAMIQNKGMGKIELIARNLANSFGKLFQKILRLVIRYQDGARLIRLRGQWVPMQPDAWNANMDVREQVGLGTGDKTQRIQARMHLLELQKQALEMGLTTPEMLYNNVSRMVRDMELGDAGQYFLDPKTVQNETENEEERTEPMSAKDKADIQVKMQEIQMKHKREVQKMYLDAQLTQRQQDIEASLAATGTPGNVGNIRLGGDVG